jgi:hypothetical protein
MIAEHSHSSQRRREYRQSSKVAKYPRQDTGTTDLRIVPSVHWQLHVKEDGTDRQVGPNAASDRSHGGRMPSVVRTSSKPIAAGTTPHAQYNHDDVE